MAAAALVVAAGLGLSWWMTNGAPGLPPQIAEVLDAIPGIEQPVQPQVLPPPSAEVVALADAAQLTDEGREIFYSTQPELLDAQAFTGRCAVGHAARPIVRTETVGCYIAQSNTIVVYTPADVRLHGFVVETAAHEALHAVWTRLSDAERAALEPLLENEEANIPADAEIRAQIAGSVGETLESRPTELFAYLGTQLWRDGGLAPELEAVYGRFIADRAALVAVHTAWKGMLDAMSADISTSSTTLVGHESTNAQSRAQLDADRGSVAFYDESYRAKAADVEAMSAGERGRLSLSWVWWDGTTLAMAPASQTLAAAAGLLARDAANLAERETTLVAAESVAAAERARIEGVLADLQALQAQLVPTSSAG